MNEITSRLFELQDIEYGDFQAKLTPNIPRERFIGVRLPKIRNLAKELAKEGVITADFMSDLPHTYNEENLLHAVLITQIKDYDECIKQIEAFLPYMDNWAITDTTSPKIFKKHLPELMTQIPHWLDSTHTYTRRFGMLMIMQFYLDDAFKPEYLDLVVGVHSDEYYVNMMIAWLMATALAKQWDATIPYLENKVMAPWTHNKTIQKAIESYRITPEQKEYLRTLKVKK